VESSGDGDKKGTADRLLDENDPLLEILKTFRASPHSQVREEMLAHIVQFEVEQLTRPGARNDFEKLCSAGCHPAVLVAIITLFRYRRHIEGFWNVVVGAPERRKDICSALDGAAAAIEQAFPPSVFDEASCAQLERAGTIPPPRLASELRLYSRMLRLAKLIGDDIGVRSLEHISMLIFASYVERTTGANHHAPIAGIVAEVLAKPDYTEDAQKQWRYRNREVLENESSLVWRISEFLTDLTTGLRQVR
jgi:hypothetical protein